MDPQQDAAPKALGRRGPSQALATASEGIAAEAANAVLTKGNAVDAVVAGVFAAAAQGASVLLGPVQILFGGAGLGLRAVDGRVRQAGKGAPRPRGFTSEQEIAPAARVGISALPAALAAALASSGQMTLNQVLAPAIAEAEGPRKDLLKRIARQGPHALVAEDIAGEIIAVCGRIAGGLVTRDDLDSIMPAIVPIEEKALQGPARRAAFVPWREEATLDQTEPSLPGDRVHVVTAIDHRGLVAAACYQRPEQGVAIDSLGIVAPFAASPVLRGQPRVRPGTPAPAAAPIALVRTLTETALDLVVALAGDPDSEHALGAALHAWSFDAEAWCPAYAGNGTLVGVARSGSNVSALTRRSL